MDKAVRVDVEKKVERMRNFWRKTTRRGHRDQQDWILIGFLELYIVRIGLPNVAKLSGGRSSYAFIAVMSRFAL